MTVPLKTGDRRPVFAVVRLDNEAKRFEHEVAVKGVYDDRELAEQEVARLKALTSQSTYCVFSTRYIQSSEPSAPIAPPRAPQISLPTDEAVSSALATLKATRDFTVAARRPAATAPLLGVVAELLVSKLLGATPAPWNASWDLVAGDRKIEVKATVMRSDHRAPSLSFRSIDFDHLVLVQFDQELTPIGVFDFSAIDIREHVKGISHQMVLRITPEFLRRYGHSLL